MTKRLQKVVAKPPAGEITLALSDLTNPENIRTLARLVYRELHTIAVANIRSEGAGRSLQASDLLNEASIRLLKAEAKYKNRRYFFGAAARMMRRILVDRARKRNAKKRGGHLRRVDLAEAERIGFDRPSDLLDLDTALRRLAAIDPKLSEVSELRVFGGWSSRETATILACGESTVRKRWATARKWLRSELRDIQKNSA